MRTWPTELHSGADPEVTLRPLKTSDVGAWRRARQRNTAWLVQWDATVPPGGDTRATTFRGLVRRLSRNARQGTTYPWVVLVDGAFAGQVTINNIVRGSAQFASVGYWLDQRYAGRGVMPRAVAMATDHCFSVAGLHRLEVAIRPENSNSLRVVEKLGIREFGYAPRYLHIDGRWRDHRLFAITRDDVPRGLLRRYEESLRTGVWPGMVGGAPGEPVGPAPAAPQEAADGAESAARPELPERRRRGGLG